jgi:hypothetical protein
MKLTNYLFREVELRSLFGVHTDARVEVNESL